MAFVGHTGQKVFHHVSPVFRNYPCRIHCIIAAYRGSLMWTLFLLLVIFYIFSLIFAELVSDFCRSATNNSTLVPVCPDNEQGLEGLVYWEGIIQCMHTLFMTITGGTEGDNSAGRQTVLVDLLFCATF